MNQVVDVFASIVADVSAKLGFDVYFHHGHMREIANVISQMEGPDTDATWPIVCLLHDFKQTESYNGTDVTITLLIIAPSMPTYLAEQRKELVFKPWLVPIYEQLKKSIAASKYIGPTAETKWPRTDHYFYGSADVMKDKNILNSWVDCIELDGLELNIHIPCNDFDLLSAGIVSAMTDDESNYAFIQFTKSMDADTIVLTDIEFCVDGTHIHPVAVEVRDKVLICDISASNYFGKTITMNIHTGNLRSTDGKIMREIVGYPVINNIIEDVQ